MMIRRGPAAHYHARRWTWLLARPDVWQDVPSLSDDVTPEGSAAITRMEAQLVEAGLFGVASYRTRRDTVRRLVGELRIAAARRGM